MTGAGAPEAVGRTSLHRRLVVALVGGGALLAVLAGVAATALVVMRDRQDAITGTYFEAISEADTAHIVLLDAKASVDGFLQTGDPGSLEVLERIGGGGSEGEDAAPTPDEVEAALLAELGTDHRVLRLRADAGAALDAWYADQAEPLIAAVRADGPAAVTPAQARAEEAAFRAMEALVVDYTGALRDERAAANAELRTWIDVTTAAFALLVVGAVVSGALLWVSLRRWVTDPLGALAADARVVADGDVHHPVAETGQGEVAALAADVELMRERLVVLVDEAASARAELEASHRVLEEQAEELRRSNRDLEQFAYVASHDLQEPLRKVASFTQLLGTRYRGRLDERADQYIDFAVDGAKRMQRLISDLLGFSRVGRVGAAFAPVDLGAALDRVVAELAEPIVETGAEVSAEPLPSVLGEEALLVQLLANLVGNALKFRRPDEPPRIRLTAERVGDTWHLACQDNGIGIDAQYADRVFVIFQRLHPKDVYEGTGIGLALCKKIVEYHGGEIWVDPAASGGTVVRWTLPAPPEEPDDAGRSEEGEADG